MRGINPIYKYLSSSNTQIKGLIAQVNHIRELDHTLKRVLDPDLASHCRIGNIQADEISILVDSPVWASQLQYKKTEILFKFNEIKKYSTISKVHIKVSPALYKQKQVKTENQTLLQSELGSQCLEMLADTTMDSSLSEALRRLSSRLKKP